MMLVMRKAIHFNRHLMSVIIILPTHRRRRLGITLEGYLSKKCFNYFDIFNLFLLFTVPHHTRCHRQTFGIVAERPQRAMCNAEWPLI